MEGIRATPLTPPHIVQIQKRVEGLAPLRFRHHGIESDGELLRDLPEPALEVVSVLPIEGRQIRRPGVLGQIDERADLEQGLSGLPPSRSQSPCQGGSDGDASLVELAEIEHSLSRGKIL